MIERPFSATVLAICVLLVLAPPLWRRFGPKGALTGLGDTP